VTVLRDLVCLVPLFTATAVEYLAGDAEVVEHGLHLVDVTQKSSVTSTKWSRETSNPCSRAFATYSRRHSYSRIVGTITQMSPLAASGRRSSILQSF